MKIKLISDQFEMSKLITDQFGVINGKGWLACRLIQKGQIVVKSTLKSELRTLLSSGVAREFIALDSGVT